MLESAKIPEARLEAEIFIMKATGFSRTKLYCSPDFEPDENQSAAFFDMVRRRMNNEPSQYITGSCEFMGIDFDVNENVLIPRNDTEILVETALEYAKKHSLRSFAEIGAGSGCIAISLAKLGKLEVVSGDISVKALETANKNAEKNDVSNRVKFIKSNLFENFGKRRFDAVVSNPPYIRRSVIASLQTEVQKFEPLTALDGGDDGLSFYRQITEEAKKHLKNGGWLFYETGYDQGKDVREILAENGYGKIDIVKDLSGLDRVVVGCLCGEISDVR